MHLNLPKPPCAPLVHEKLSSTKLALLLKTLGTAAVNLSFKEFLVGYSAFLLLHCLLQRVYFILFLYCVLYYVKEIIIKALSS